MILEPESSRSGRGHRQAQTEIAYNLSDITGADMHSSGGRHTVFL